MEDIKTCLRCSRELETDEDKQTGICASCFTDEDRLPGDDF